MAECQRAADEALAAYVADFNDSVLAEDSALQAEHRRALDAARGVYQWKAVGDEATRTANFKRFNEAADVRFRELRERKLATAALACERLISVGATEMAKVVVFLWPTSAAQQLYDAPANMTRRKKILHGVQVSRQENATLAALQTALDNFERRFASQAEGPDKWKRFSEFIRSTYVGCLEDVAQRALQRAQQETTAADSRALQAQSALQEVCACVSRQAEVPSGGVSLSW